MRNLIKDEVNFKSCGISDNYDLVSWFIIFVFKGVL